MQNRDEDADSTTNLPRIPSKSKTPVYDSPFAIPDDAEVPPETFRYSEWRREKKNASGRRRKETENWRYGRRVSRSKESASGNSTSWGRKKRRKIPTNPRAASSRRPRTPSRTGSGPTNPCISLLTKHAKLWSFRCWSTINEKRSMSSKSSPNSTGKD